MSQNITSSKADSIVNQLKLEINKITQTRRVVVEYYRLDGSTAVTALPYTDGFTSGTDGNTATIPGGFVSLSMQWERDTLLDSTVTIGTLVKTAGALAATAGYIPLLPELNVPGAFIVYQDPVTATVSANAYVDIMVTRYA